MSEDKKPVPKSFAQAEEDRADELNINQESSKDAATVSLEEFNKLKAELEVQTVKANDNWDKLVRKEAELRNAETRANTAIERERKYALEKIFKEILTVLDSFDGGIESLESTQDVDAAKEGMNLIHTLLVDTLAKFGLEVVSPLGIKFDPSQHEAMTMQQNPEFESNTVCQVIQKGYLLNGRVIRPARVIVAKS